MIKFPCALCKKKIGVSEKYAGKEVKCPGCGQSVRVPKAGPDSASVSQTGRKVGEAFRVIEAMEGRAPLALQPYDG